MTIRTGTYGFHALVALRQNFAGQEGAWGHVHLKTAFEQFIADSLCPGDQDRVWQSCLLLLKHEGMYQPGEYGFGLVLM